MNEKSKKLWQTVAILSVNLILLILVSLFNTKAATLGDSGERIAQIQRELQRNNVYSGKINGLLDFETKHGIAEFQSFNGIERRGESDLKTLWALGLDSRHSDCFSSRTELLARCIQQSGCRTYSEMLIKAIEIIEETNDAQTLGKYISKNFPDFAKNTADPSDDAYNAAIQAIRIAVL